MNEQDLRDCFAMFAMMGVISDGSLSAISFQNKTDLQKDISTFAYEMADAMLEAREAKGTVGLPPVRARKTKEK